MDDDVKKGVVAGTGAPINVSIGFQPTKVDLYNTYGRCQMNWTDQMSSNTFKTFKDDGNWGKPEIASASGAISMFSGNVSDGEGFTIPADGDLNKVGEDIRWTAYR